MENIKEYFFDNITKFYANDEIRTFFLSRNRIYGISKETEDFKIFKDVFERYAEESKLTLSFLTIKRGSMLEVGGGIGLTYAFLKKKGHDITSIEPSGHGFDGCYDVGHRLLNELGIDDSGWLPMEAKDLGKLNKKFDVIFSNNVLEHIKDTEEAFDGMIKVMKNTGVMVHNTVNYLVPYEPHFKIPLIPFFPRLTQILIPRLKQSDLWKGLNFINSNSVKKLSNRYGLMIRFDKEVLYKTLIRFESDKEFAYKHGALSKLFYIINKMHLIKLTKYLPVSMMTPMRFWMERSG